MCAATYSYVVRKDGYALVPSCFICDFSGFCQQQLRFIKWLQLNAYQLVVNINRSLVLVPLLCWPDLKVQFLGIEKKYPNQIVELKGSFSVTTFVESQQYSDLRPRAK